jgi:hypothetical protein
MIKQLLIAGLLLMLVMPCGSAITHVYYEGGGVGVFTYNDPYAHEVHVRTNTL